MTLELTTHQRGLLRGTCGICCEFYTDIANRFHGGNYYQEMCDVCYDIVNDILPYKHNYTTGYKLTRNYRIADYERHKIVNTFTFWRRVEQEIDEDRLTDFEEAVREYAAKALNIELERSDYDNRTIQ